MSVLKRGDSKFWYVQFQYNGRTYIKSSKSTDKKIAELLEAEWKKQLMTQRILGTKPRITLVQAFDQFLNGKRGLASHRQLSGNVKVVTESLPHIKYLDELTSADIERLKGKLTADGYSAQSIKHMMGVIRGAWKHAKKMGHQVSDLEFPSISISKGKLRYLTFDEERKLLAAIDPKRAVKGLPLYEDRTKLMRREMHDLYDFIVLLIDTGARHGEIAPIKWEQVNLKQGTIALWRPKVRNESILFMTDRVKDILQRRRREKTGPFVFSNRSDGPRSYIGTTLRRAFKRAGLPDCSAHTLRHTHATRLIQNGLSIYEVKELLGHTDIKTTMRYAHIEQTAASRKARELINRLNKQIQSEEQYE